MSTRDWRRTEIDRRDTRKETLEGKRIVSRSTSGQATVKADFNRVYTSKYQYKPSTDCPLLKEVSNV
jgi:hypothetical protein